MFPELKDKIVLVIGSSQGIGKSVVETFLDNQSVVIAADITYDFDELLAVNKSYFQTHLDVSQETEVSTLSQVLINNKLIPDIVVDVAGISTMDFLVDSQTSDFDQTFEVNTRGTYLVAKYFTKVMIDHGRKGRMIVIASQAGKNGYRGMAAYVASKHAVLGLVKTLAIEAASNQILVNAVCPGIIETEMKQRERVEGGALRGMSAEDVRQEDISQVPLGRTGTPQDVANVVLFLASPLSSYMTGQAINVTGGMTMH
ncbi:SDR family oxidoreductase [Enterococcus avium]|uniref:SDR family oxidoreductase n=1 Tax=Enterococcus avium TaxID=33945 RepID=UPI0026FF7999|nr:SDR family NAD(P)-dependent oxidoreductase [Enterococcus avium]MDO7798989.1 SDR family NAD(P)-dependent oxidoreductase [Enterococcus avium]